MALSSETYSEYFAYCSKCQATILEVIEYMDLKKMDDSCGVCCKCRKLFCRKCVVERDDAIYCPNCNSKLIEFWGCSPYDLIAILSHDCQPFEKTPRKKECV